MFDRRGSSCRTGYDYPSPDYGKQVVLMNAESVSAFSDRYFFAASSSFAAMNFAHSCSNIASAAISLDSVEPASD